MTVDGSPPAGAVEPDWDQAVADFRRRRIDTLQSYLLRGGNALGGLERLFQADVSGSQRTAMIERAFTRLPPVPCARSTLALYVLGLARQRWEASTAWEIIDDVLTRAHHVALGLPPTEPDDAGPDVDGTLLVAAYGAVVQRAMQVENALNCSCPYELEHQAHLASTTAGESVERARDLPGELDGPLRLFRAIAETDRAYFACVRDIGRAMQRVLARDVDAPGWVESTVAAVSFAIDGPVLRDDVFATELRTHRRTLQTFEEHSSQPWLHASKAKVTYVYPFALPTDDPAALCHRAYEGYQDMRLAGSPPDHAADSPLSDMWDSADPSGRAYTGVSLYLDPVVVTTTDRSRPRELVFTTEVRMSRLGNHYLRLELDVFDADPHTINQCFRRPSGSMGLERILIGGAEYRTRLLDHAVAIVADLSHHLVGGAVGDETARTRLRGALDRAVHVVLSIRQLAITRPDGSREPADGRILLGGDAVGTSLLAQPVRQTASSLDEWIRYPTPRDLGAAQVGEAFSGDVVLRTANTTVICMTGTPDFLVKNYEEGAEFVASLAVLFTQWSREVTDATRAAEAEVESNPRARTAIQRKRLTLHRRIRSIHSMLALLRSPLFCKTATARHYLDGLYLRAGLPGLEAALRAELDDAGAAYDEMATVLLDVERTLDEEAHQNVERVLAAIAAVSLADLFALLNPEPLPGVLAALEVLTMVLLGVAIVILTSLRRSSEPSDLPR
jgi:hypothetical protein